MIQSQDALDVAGSWLGHIVHDSWSGERLDGWTNDLTGYGTALDKTEASYYLGKCDLSNYVVDALYHGDDVAQRVIDTYPEEAMSKGYCLNIGKPLLRDVEAAILQSLETLDSNAKIVEAAIWGSLYGGSAIVLGADDGRPATMPLIPERVRKVDALEVIDRRFMSVQSIYRAGPKIGQPEIIGVGNLDSSRPLAFVHESRLIMFGGARTSRLNRVARGHWDQSALQRPWEVIRSFATGFKSVETLLTDGPQGVYKIKNLAALLGSNKKQALKDRIETVELMRSALRAIVVDSEQEGFERASFSFSGIPDVLDKLMLRLSAAARIPVTLLMGQSPAGMNATGESDFRGFYGNVAVYQQNVIKPRLKRLIDVICLSKEGPTGGKIPDQLEIKFNKLWSLDPLQESQRRLAVAQTDQIYHTIGALSEDEIALSRFGERGWSDDYEIDRDLRQANMIEDSEDVPPPVAVTPTANEAAFSVDEVRAAQGVGPDPDPEFGKLKIAAAAAQLAAQGAVEGDAAGKENTGQPVVPPPPQIVAAPGAPNGNRRADPFAAGTPKPKAPPTKPNK